MVGYASGGDLYPAAVEQLVERQEPLKQQRLVVLEELQLYNILARTEENRLGRDNPGLKSILVFVVRAPKPAADPLERVNERLETMSIEVPNTVVKQKVVGKKWACARTLHGSVGLTEFILKGNEIEIVEDAVDRNRTIIIDDCATHQIVDADVAMEDTLSVYSVVTLHNIAKGFLEHLQVRDGGYGLKRLGEQEDEIATLLLIVGQLGKTGSKRRLGRNNFAPINHWKIISHVRKFVSELGDDVSLGRSGIGLK